MIIDPMLRFLKTCTSITDEVLLAEISYSGPENSTPQTFFFFFFFFQFLKCVHCSQRLFLINILLEKEMNDQKQENML